MTLTSLRMPHGIFYCLRDIKTPRPLVATGVLPPCKSDEYAYSFLAGHDSGRDYAVDS